MARKVGHYIWAPVAGLLPLVPAILLLAVAFVWPISSVLRRSLNRAGQVTTSGGITFENYISLFSNDLLRQIWLETVRLALYATPITVLLAFPTAYLMSRLPRRGGLALLALVTTPFWVSILLRLFALTAILGRKGVVNEFFALFGLGPFDLLFNTRATVIGMVTYLLPYMILVLYGAMTSIDTSLLTAARTMGASGRQTFLHIYLPQVRSAVISGTTLVFVIGLSFFLTPAILGAPNNITLPIYIAQKIKVFEWATASAAGIALLVVSSVGYAIAIKIGGASLLTGSYAVGRGVAGREPLRLSVGTVVSWIAVGIVLLLLLLPIFIIIPASFGTTSQIQFPPKGFTTGWYAQVLHDPIWVGAFIKTVRVGLGTAVLSVAVALGLARAGIRVQRNWIRTTIQSMAFAPLVVPGILLAVGIYDVQLTLGTVDTDLGLILGHSVSAFPLAFILVSNGMSKLDSSLETAAWSLGAFRFRAFWTILIPNLVPALVAAFVLSFMTSFDEVMVALFLTGLNKTLPIVIYSLVLTGVTPAVGAVAVLLILPVVVGVIGTLLWSGCRPATAADT
ncbi:ABC transporter permease subunit [Mesorhizobium sp. M0029]|uniref:ABC transporter permease subunit n=1 Tax=Mesorhizobium sp. M0029 TaxID=2956850 RepID=UPI00333B5704